MQKLPVSVSVCRILGDKIVTVLRVPVSSLLVTISEGVVRYPRQCQRSHYGKSGDKAVTSDGDRGDI